MNEATDQPRETALLNYLRVLRRRRLLIGIVTLVFLVLAVVYTTQQPTKYQAKATVLFEDPGEDLSLTGAVGGAFRTAQQRAQIGADTIITPALAGAVKRRLHSTLSVKQIEDSLSATADAASSQVTLQAEAGSGRDAARIANVAAQVGARRQAAAERSRYSRAADRLEQRARQLGASPQDASQRTLYADQISRLRTLSTLAKPVQVASRATAPTSASSPKPVSTAIIAVILGLIVGLIAAFIREAVERRLRSTGDIEDVLDLSVLGHVGRDAMGKAGSSTRGLGRLSEPDVEAFRIVRTNLRFNAADRSQKLVLVTSPMPEEGKSTVAASLAFSYAMAGRLTLLLECDFRRPSLAERLGVAPTPGLVDYLAGTASPTDVEQVIPDSPTGQGRNGSAPEAASNTPLLAAIVAGRLGEGQSAELFETDAFVEFLGEVTEAFDVVVVDTPPLLPVADTLELVQHVDAVLLCVRASRTTRSQATAAKNALEPVHDRLAGVVVTGVSERERGSYGYYGYYGYGSAGTPTPASS